MQRSCRRRRFAFSRGFILTIALIIPNYLGLPLKIDRHNLTKDINNQPLGFLLSTCKSNSLTVQCLGKLEVVESSPWHGISWAAVGVLILIIFVGPYLGLLGIRFLKDQPLNKQSILNKLSRDCAKIAITFLVIWITYIITAKCIENPQNWELYLQVTKLISYANEATFFLGMLYVCLIGSLRLYTIINQVPDPLEEYFGEHEDMAVLLIRLILSAIVIAYIGLVSLTSATPIVYHKLTELDLNLNEVSWKSQLKLGFNITCAIIATMLFATGKSIQRKKNDVARAQGSMSNTRNESNETNEFSYYVSSVSIMYLSSTLFIFVIMLLFYLGVIYVNIWWGLTMLLAVQGVGMPIAFLALNLTFRNYCWRQFRIDLNYCMTWVDRFAKTIKQRNSRVSPLQ